MFSWPSSFYRDEGLFLCPPSPRAGDFRAQAVPIFQGGKFHERERFGRIPVAWPGGQGAKTACLLLADAAFSSGKFVQGFPEYGPERMGAPITAYNRISDTRCSIHCNIDCPDYVVVVDETLLDTVDVTKGLSPTGAVIVNTAKCPRGVRASSALERGRCAP